MAKLDDLLRIDGVMAAGEFAADGTRATVSMVFTTLGAAFSHLTPLQFTPQQGWAFSGGDMTVAVGGRVGVFIRTEKADFNRLFKALVG
jgi:roadblock/LC7 domain-containing protein